MENKKPVLDSDSIQVLEETAKQVMESPDTPERAATLAKLKNAYQAILQQNELPVPALAPDSAMLRLLEFIPGVSYAGGLARTAVGEAAVAAKDIPSGKYDPKAAGGRILDAVAPDVPFVENGPFSKSAKSVGEYTDLLGVKGTGGLIFPPNEYANPTYRGALETLGGMALDPALLRSILSPKTATSMAGKTAEFLVNPAESTGEALLKSRFKEADLKNIAAGKRPFSEVFRETKAPGITSEGVRAGLPDIIAKESQVVDDILKEIDAAKPIGGAPKATMSEVLSPLDSPEMQKKLTMNTTNEAYGAAKEEVLAPFEKEILSNPSAKRVLQEKELLSGKAVLDADGNPQFVSSKDLPQTRPEMTLEPTSVTRPGVKVEFRFKDGSLAPNEDFVAGKGWPERVVLPQDVTGNILQPKLSINDINPEAVPLIESAARSPIEEFSGGIEYDPRTLGELATQYGEKAARAGYFSKPSIFDVQKTGKSLEKQAALADVYNKLRGKTRELQLKGMEEFSPGMSAPAVEANKRMASLYEGAPFIDKKARRGASNLRVGMGPVSSFVDAFPDASTLKLGAAKALLNPWTQYLAQPAVRASVAEGMGDTRRKQQSPWSYINQIVGE